MEASGHSVSRPEPLRISNATWLGAAALVAAGAGILAATNSMVAMDLALLLIGFVIVRRWPIALLVFVLAVETRHSPFIELFVAASTVILLPQILHAPARVMLIPLAAFLLFVLPGVNFGGSQLSALGKTLLIPGPNITFLHRPSPELMQWLRVAFALGLALLAAVNVRTTRQLRLVIGTLVVSSVYAIFVGFQQWAGGQFVTRNGFKAVQGPLGYPSEYGFYLVIIVILAIVGVFEMRTRRLRLLSGLIALMGLALLQHSYTRSAWIGFALALIVLAVFHYRRLIVASFVVFVIALVAVPGQVNSVQARFGDLSSQNAANSKNSLKWRRGEWARMTHFGDEKPLYGQGFGSYQRLTVKEFGYQDHTFSTLRVTPGQGVTTVGFAAHNDYVKLYVETGIPGAALWTLVLLGVVFAGAVAARSPELKPWAVATAALGVAFALMSASDNIQSYGVPIALLFTLAAALAGAYRGTARRAGAPTT